jgi:serine/threonine-protein kinase
LLVGLLILVSALLMWRPWATEPPEPTGQIALSVEIPREMEMNLIDWAAVAASNDGSAVAITARAEGQLTIQLRKLNEPGFTRLSPKGNAFGPFFSPDGQWVGYYSDGRLLKVSIDGGAPVEIVDLPHPRGAVWGNDGYVYYAPTFSSGIHRRSESGTGDEEIMTVVDKEKQERTHRWPDVLPDGRGFVFTVGTTDSPGNYEDAEIAVYDARSGEMRYLGVQGATARWSPSGDLLVMRNGVLHAVPLDLETLTLNGAPTPVFDGIRGDSASGIYYFAVNQRGDFYYVPAREGGPRRSLVWVDRDGSIEPVPLEPGQYRFPRIHPDGKLAALVRGEGHGSHDDDIHLLDLDNGSLTRFTFEQTSFMPNWHPSGKSLFYASIPGMIKAKGLDDASGSRTVLGDIGMIALPGSIGSRGKMLLATVIGQASLGDVYALDLSNPSSLDPLIQTAAAEWGPALSPDEKWVAYCSDETGREEIFVQPYPPTGAKWQVSKDGGRAPLWSHGGDELFFVEGNNFYAVRVSTQPSFRVQTPEVLFEHRMDNSGVPLRNYDVSADDQRFLIVESDAAAHSRQFRVVLGWLDGLSASGRR